MEPIIKDPYQRWFWIIWPSVTVVSLCVLGILATHPSLMLWIEESHPSVAYGKGDRLRHQEKLERAIEEYQRGIAYFKELYQEHKQSSHLRQWVLGVLRQADTYAQIDTSEAWEEALGLYEIAIELDPEMSRGQPFLARGQLLSRMQRYSEAIESYNHAMEKGQGHTDLISYYGRGLCFLRLKKYEKATEAWYWFTRFVPEPEPEQIEVMLELPENENHKREAILGYLYLLEQEIKPALDYLENYLEVEPQDRFAQYSRAIISEATYEADQGDYPLEECFPPSEEEPRTLQTTVIDVNAHDAQSMRLSIRLSTETSTKSLPQVRIDRSNGDPITVHTSRARTYETRIELEKGRNLVRLETLQPDPNEAPPTIYLHALSLEPLNTE